MIKYCAVCIFVHAAQYSYCDIRRMCDTNAPTDLEKARELSGGVLKDDMTVVVSKLYSV